MSGYKTHVGAGATAGVLTVTLIFIASMLGFKHEYYDSLKLEAYLLCIPIAAFFGLMPDIDIKSKASKLFYALVIVGAGTLFWFQHFKIASGIIIVSLLPQFLNHRGILHKPIMAFIFPLSMYSLVYYNVIDLPHFVVFYIAGMAGYFSHLIVDGTI